MKLSLVLGVCLVSAAFGCALAVAQEYGPQSGPPPAREYPPDASPVPLDWVPPPLAELGSMAAMKENFTLDRNLLGVAAGAVSDSDAPVRQAAGKAESFRGHAAELLLEKARLAHVRRSQGLGPCCRGRCRTGRLSAGAGAARLG